jgi:class 3 adenylate cyclase
MDPAIFVDYSKQFADLGVGGPLRDPNTGTVIGIYGAFFRAVVLIDYLKSLKVAKTGQAFLIEASTQKYIGGTSSDPSVKTVVSGGVSTVVLTTPSDIVEPVSRRAIDALGSQLYTCTSCSMRVGDGSDMLFVSVSALRDSYGLNLRIVVAIPSDDFLGPINSGMKVGLAAAAGSIAGFILVVAVALHILLIPLKRLEQQLYASSTLELSDDDGHRESIISEIANIQTASTELQKELKKVEAFLPQSVLRRLEQADDDEEDPAMIASASVSATDESSTPNAAAGAGQLQSSMVRRLSSSTLHSSNSRKRNAAKGQGISGDMNVSLRRVTMLSINLGGLVKFSETATPSQLQFVLARCMDAVLSLVNMAKGVVESVSGDHFVVSLNASTNCGTHATRAAALILSLSQAHRTDAGAVTSCGVEASIAFTALMSRIQIGCATSNALCGNFGTDRLRRFSVLGSVLNHAFHLMTRCRAYDVCALVTGSSAEMMALEYDVQHVGLEHVPHASKPVIFSTVVRKKEAADDEWMYQVNNKDNTSRHDQVEQDVNQVFELIAEGKSSEATELVNRLPERHVLVARCKEALKLCGV